MKKSIFAAFLIISVCLGVSWAQTKKRTTHKATTTKKQSTKPKTKNKMTEKTVNNAAVTTLSGLTYIITKRGEGAQLKAGDTVIINYTGMFTNGVKFDSSLDSNEPYQFPLGAGRVIKGWDEGIQKLRIGDHATLIVPPALGYGESGYSIIPPNATLIFIVEVIGVK